MARRILVTRPQPDADETAIDLRAMGWTAMCAPMLKMVPILPPPEADVPRIDDVTGVVLTSRNGARALALHPLSARIMERNLPIYTVGDATKSAARAVGFANLVSAGGDVEDLIALIVRQCDPPRTHLLYACGRQITVDLAARLSALRLCCDGFVVYDMQAADMLPDDVVRALEAGNLQAAMFYSARTAEAFIALADTYGLSEAAQCLAAVCIGAAAADVLRSAGWDDVTVAGSPDHAAMLRCVRAMGVGRD